MTASENRLVYLYRQYVNKSCTSEEMLEFFEYVRDPAYGQALETMAEEHLETTGVPAGLPVVDWEFMYRSVVPAGELSGPLPIGNGVGMGAETGVDMGAGTGLDTSADSGLDMGAETGSNRRGRVVPLFTWSRVTARVAAAVLILVLCGGGYFFLTRRPVRSPERTMAMRDIKPGCDKAILTLANGDSITLDSAHAGMLTQQGMVVVLDSGKGQLVYTVAASSKLPAASKVAYNTLTTPRGGQYQLTLPDGTKVWLNAASSLTYPTAFSGNERTVQMTGEAYFEVTHDKKKPFKVKVGGQVIEDIGTHFNINAYTDEPVQTTTLLEGAVRVGGHVLKPGEKASVASSGTVRVSRGDPEQAIAWKNGLFDFTDNDLPTVLRQLARWYNVDIKYEGKIPDRQFTGMIGRSLTLTQVLKGLTREEVQYRIEEGNHLIITP